jgi:hypothetical protein
VPSDFSASAWSIPAAMAATFESPATARGVELEAPPPSPSWPYSLLPQDTTVPSDLSATAWRCPAETATTFESPASWTGVLVLEAFCRPRTLPGVGEPGGCAPEAFAPQPQTVPSFLTASE